MLFFMLICFVIAIIIAVIIVAPFIRAWPYDKSLTYSHFMRIIDAGMLGRLVSNSVIMSLCTGVLGVIISLFAGYMYVRDPNGLRAGKKLMHGLYMTALAVPGLALGLSFALFFKGTFIYNTLAIMIVVNIVHFIGSPYMMAVSHFKLLNPNLEAICRTLGGNFLNVLADVVIPNSKKMLLDVFVYFFTNTMVTISAISLLYSAQRMTLSLQITAFNGQGRWESALAVSLIILLLNMAAKAVQSLSKETAPSEPDT
jgi:iron(III) transport system permease protein